MKKIACLLGSPRPGGNSETIARKIISLCEDQGATADVFPLCKLSFRGCVACLACKKTHDACVLQDDLTQVLKAVREADILIMASPIYFGAVTGVMKMAIDRMYSLMDPAYLTGGKRTRLEPGKQCVFVLTQGAPDENAFKAALGDYMMFFGPDWFGYQMHMIRGLGLSKPTDAAERTDLMEQAEAVARQLMS